MGAVEFLDKLKRRCSDVGASCEQCRFREYCYTLPKDYTPEFVSQTLGRLTDDDG